MKKTILKTLLCSTLIISLTGCGVRNTAENSSADGQSKIMGKEISMAETGSAKVLPSVYPKYCTDNCFYWWDGMCIIQYDLDGKELQKFDMPDVDKKNQFESIQSLYVTDEEILYVVHCRDDKSGAYGFYGQLCSVPVRQDGDKEQLLTDEVEKLFKVDDSMVLLYADKQFVAYEGDLAQDTYNSSYYEYDRAQKKQISICKEDKETAIYSFKWEEKYFWGGDSGVGSDTVFLIKSDKKRSAGDRYHHDMYVHKVGSGEVRKIATCYSDNRYRDDFCTTAADGRIYYSGVYGGDADTKEGTDQYSEDIWCYDPATGENRMLVSEEEIKKIYPDFAYYEGLVAVGDFLYVTGTTNEVEKDGTLQALYRVIRISLNGDIQIEPEEELNAFLNEYTYVDIKSIAGGRCYVEAGKDYEENFYVFDLSSKESKEVKKSDPEYYVWEFEADELLEDE